MGAFSMSVFNLGSRRRRPTDFVHELVDYTGSDRAVRDLDASLETYSADLDGAIEIAEATQIANEIIEFDNRQDRRTIDRIAEMIDEGTRGLYGDSRRGVFKNPKKIILPVLFMSATCLMVFKRILKK